MQIQHFAALALVAASVALPAQAAVVEYDLSALGGSAYRYTFENNGSLGGGQAIELFDILFDPLLYQESSISITTPPALAADWSEVVLSSAPGVPAAYDALALTGGIPNGQSQSGFSVDFTWLGSGTPGSQGFVIYDPTSFAVLEQGQTTSPVPLPAAFWLLVSGLAGVFCIGRPRNDPSQRSRKCEA